MKGCPRTIHRISGFVISFCAGGRGGEQIRICRMYAFSLTWTYKFPPCLNSDIWAEQTNRKIQQNQKKMLQNKSFCHIFALSLHLHQKLALNSNVDKTGVCWQYTTRMYVLGRTWTDSLPSRHNSDILAELKSIKIILEPQAKSKVSKSYHFSSHHIFHFIIIMFKRRLTIPLMIKQPFPRTQCDRDIL